MRLRPTRLLLCAWALAAGVASAQAPFALDPALPALPLTESTRLGVLASPLGSRFSLSVQASEGGVHTGALGYGQDAFARMTVEVEVANGRAAEPLPRPTGRGTPTAPDAPLGPRYAFHTGGVRPGVAPLLDQTVRVGMTGVVLEGRTPEGVRVTATIVTPFTPSESLADTSALLTQIAPRHVVLVRVEAPPGRAASGTVRVGFDALPYNADRFENIGPGRLAGPLDALVWREGPWPSPTRRALAFATGAAERFQDGPFHGLHRPFTARAGGAWADTLVYAAHHGGRVQRDTKRGQDLRFYYTRFFDDVEGVLAYARESAAKDLARAESFERLLTRSDASPEEKWTLAVAARSDAASTLLLLDEDGRPHVYVLEGRFRHQSTVDVAHETELMALFAPWRLRLQLATWAEYVATAEAPGAVRNGERVTEGVGAAEYGPYVYHDVGDYPFVSPTTDYTYGPHMAVEENANYALLLYWYWRLTGDDAFVQQRLGLLNVLMQSLVNRDTDGSGLADAALGWTTYDVSEALKTAPENVYLGVKQAAAYLAAADLFERLAVRPSGSGGRDGGPVGIEDGEGRGYSDTPRTANVALRQRQAAALRAQADRIVATLEAARARHGYLPVSLDTTADGWDQRSVVLGEGLLLPGLAGLDAPPLGRIAALLTADWDETLRQSTRPYGVVLSSGESVTWFSKVMGADRVAATWYDRPTSSAAYAFAANRDNETAYNDGLFSETERWTGFWYPRGVTALGYVLPDGFTAADRDAFLRDLRAP